MVKNKLIIALTLFLALLALFAAALPALAANDKYDLSNRDRDSSVSIDARVLIERYAGASVSAAERAFLDSYSTMTLKYNTVINSSNVSLEYSNGILTVIAREYTYNTDGGKSLVWIPRIALINGAEIPLEKADSGYKAELVMDSAADASIVYYAETEILKEDFNLVLNLYHDTARYAYDIEDYEKKTELYAEYLYEKRIYDDKKAEYDKYIADCADYQNQLYVYENFDNLMAQYVKDLDKYNAYLLHLEDLDADIKKYEEYEAKLTKIEKQLSAFELVYVRMKNDRDVYGAVMGGAVDQVLGSVGEIIAELGGKYETLVKTAEAATKSLRGLMTGYKNCQTPEEKYGFYTASYPDMCDSMLDLTWALDLLYYAPGVKPMLKAFEKHESYVILVAQLVLISNALIDGDVSAGEGKTFVEYDTSWIIDGRNFNTVLNGVVYFEDDDTSKPIDGGYPIKVEKPELEAVEKPTIPKRPSSRPVAPEAVSDPGDAPREVAIPMYPGAKNSRVTEIYSSLDDDKKAELISGISSGHISKREEALSNINTELQSIVCKKYDSKAIIVTFDASLNGTNTSSFIHTVETDADSAVFYDGPIPDNYSNISGSYEFAGWRLEGTSEKVDLTQGFSESTVLVPFYERKPNYYSVTWVVDGEKYVEKYPAESIPEPSFVPQKADSGDFLYEFDGWMRDGNKTYISKLYSDVTYEAKFVPKYLLPYGNGGASVTVTEREVSCDVSSFASSVFNVSKLLPKISGKHSLRLVNESTDGGVPRFELIFSFTDVVNMNKAGVEFIFMTGGLSEDDSSLELSFYAKNNVRVDDLNVRPELTVRHACGDLVSLVLLSNSEYVNAKISKESISLSPKPSTVYTLKREYHVTVVDNELCEITVDKKLGGKGDKISVSVFPLPGVSVLGIDVVDNKGNAVFLNGDGSFSLDEGDVIISVRAKHILYNVEFVSSGAVILRQELIYGAMPQLPPDPTVASDGVYKYTFAGWSPAVTEVCGNAIYEALFEKSPVDAQDAVSQDNPIANIMKYVKIAVTVAVVLLFACIALVIFLVIRRKNKRKSLNKNSDSDTSDDKLNARKNSVKNKKSSASDADKKQKNILKSKKQ